MANSEVSRLKFNNTTYDIADELARQNIGTARTEIATEAARLDAVDTGLAGRITNLENSAGAVLVAKTRTAMTDTNKIYVYTGTTTTASGVTYTKGHWYYHNGSKWTDGGEYNQNLDAIDATLTQSNKGADAKVTGDRLTAAETDISTLRGTIASEYASQAYAVGDYCYHNGLLYRCNTEISVGETWTSGHWTAVDVMPELNNLKSDMDAAVFDGSAVFDTSTANANFDNLVNNHDGTYTVTPSDWGRARFGEKKLIKAGCYKLFGAPFGETYLSTDGTFANQVVSNTGAVAKIITIEKDAELYLCYRLNESDVQTSNFTIHPYFFQTKIEDALVRRYVPSGYSILKICGIGNPADDAGCWRKDDIYYNTNRKKLRKALSNDVLHGDFEDVPFEANKLYYNVSDEQYYFWDSDKQTLAVYDALSDVNLLTERPELRIAKHDARTNKLVVPSVGGKLVTAGIDKTQYGYILQHITDNDDKYFEYLSTAPFITYNGALVEIGNEAYDDVTVFCYDDDFFCRTYVDSLAAVPPDTCYIKVMLHKTGGFSELEPIIITYRGKAPALAKNTVPQLGVAHYFSYEVHVGHYTNAKESSDDYSGDQTRYFDDAYIILPPNYSPTGDPVQMIIYTHGSNGYAFGDTQPLYYDYQKALAQDGYCVCDCRALTNKYLADDLATPAEEEENAGNLDDGITPLAVACYCHLYDYMMANYNIRTDGCFVYGKSSGGLWPALFSAMKPFEIRAAACLAPMLSLFTDLSGAPNWSKMVYWQLEQFGYDMTGISPDYPPGPTKEQVLAQSDLLTGYDPLLCNTDLDDKTIDTHLAGHNNDISDEAVESLSAGKHKYQNIPVKIWVAEDDMQIRQGVIKFYKRLVDNAGGICKLRRYSAGLGGHHAVDDAANAPKVDYKTRYGGTINMPAAYAEMLDWFKQW